MLSDLAVGVPRGPPPQAVLEKRSEGWGLSVSHRGVFFFFVFAVFQDREDCGPGFCFRFGGEFKDI